MNNLYTNGTDVSQIAIPPTWFIPFPVSLKWNFILSPISTDLTLCVKAAFFHLSGLSPNTLLFTAEQSDASFQSGLV